MGYRSQSVARGGPKFYLADNASNIHNISYIKHSAKQPKEWIQKIMATKSKYNRKNAEGLQIFSKKLSIGKDISADTLLQRKIQDKRISVGGHPQEKRDIFSKKANTRNIHIGFTNESANFLGMDSIAHECKKFSKQNPRNSIYSSDRKSSRNNLHREIFNIRNYPMGSQRRPYNQHDSFIAGNNIFQREDSIENSENAYSYKPSFQVHVTVTKTPVMTARRDRTTAQFSIIQQVPQPFSRAILQTENSNNEASISFQSYNGGFRVGNSATIKGKTRYSRAKSNNNATTWKNKQS